MGGKECLGNIYNYPIKSIIKGGKVIDFTHIVKYI